MSFIRALYESEPKSMDALLSSGVAVRMAAAVSMPA
jgi:hypothetical protein